jgi:hypothetical protein
MSDGLKSMTVEEKMYAALIGVLMSAEQLYRGDEDDHTESE